MGEMAADALCFDPWVYINIGGASFGVKTSLHGTQSFNMCDDLYRRSRKIVQSFGLCRMVKLQVCKLSSRIFCMYEIRIWHPSNQSLSFSSLFFS
ncbi:hypothetical protein YC2023_103182 [Brassica napus]